MQTDRKSFWELANMSDAEYAKEDEKYRYCYVVNGQRYRFKENPYEFAIQKAREMYPAEIEERIANLFYWGALRGDKNMPCQENYRRKAEKDVSRLVVTDPHFGEWLLASLEWKPDLEWNSPLITETREGFCNMREEEMDRDR